MGTFTWPLRISSMDGQQSLDIEATVDTGAFYTMLPARLLRELGIEPVAKRMFLVADGRRVERSTVGRGPRWTGRARLPSWPLGKTTLHPCWGPTPWRGWLLR